MPDVSCDQILATTKWLKSVVQAMNKHNEGFSRFLSVSLRFLDFNLIED